METFGWVPLISWESKPEYSVNITTFDSGKEQRSFKGTRPTVWTVEFCGSKALITAIENFYKARKGSFEAFTWTPPFASSSITARFTKNDQSFSYEGGLYASCKLEIQEVL
jgi:phage-related protein